MEVYVVANYDNGDEYFCDVDSVWSFREHADQRRDALIEEQGYDTRWDVFEVPFNDIPSEG